VDWPDSKGLNEWERKALELAGEQSKLARGDRGQGVALEDVPWALRACGPSR